MVKWWFQVGLVVLGGGVVVLWQNSGGHGDHEVRVEKVLSETLGEWRINVEEFVGNKRVERMIE